jgi:ADP-ribose pyrophosphatase
VILLPDKSKLFKFNELNKDGLNEVKKLSFKETGYAGEILHLCSTWISAYSNARKHIYLMLNAEKVAAPEMADADLFRVTEISRDEFDLVLKAGALTDLDAGLACLKKLDLMKVA